MASSDYPDGLWDDDDETSEDEESSEETSTSYLSSLSSETVSRNPIRVTMTPEEYERWFRESQNRQQQPMKTVKPKPLKSLLGNDLSIPKKRKINLE